MYELYSAAAAAASAAAAAANVDDDDDYDYDDDYDNDDDYDMAVPWIKRLVAGSSPRNSGLDPRLFYVGFEVVKEGL